MFIVRISLVDPPWMRVRPDLTIHSERPPSKCPDRRAVFAGYTGGTGDLGAIDTAGPAGGYPTDTAELVNYTVGVPRREPFVGRCDPAGPQTRTPNAELTARFVRDAIPLRARRSTAGPCA
ncbi:MAG: hypothetical protein JWR32_4861 [Mycobacterium sp.]|jgi:hypothetical protein|nr:hypothetical protein [Mycobacterium sp.]